MMRLIRSAVAAAWLLATWPALAASPHTLIEAQIGAMMAAANTHDTDAFLKPFMHGPRLVFVMNGHVIQGWSALHAAQLKWWRYGASNARYSQTSLTSFTDVAPNVIVTTQQLESRRTGSGGHVEKGAFEMSAVWRRHGKGWRIVYACESWVR